ncbi:2'-5' RNA ligase family protein [Microbispora sp. NPDC046933]|uniref:2'-5' RNA ligase family protein n=1 Tax=Microbispora sp. NPDC046933 TaxID=3155618 RepID=UPI0033D2D595
MAPFEIGETALVVEVPSAEPLVRGLRERYDSSAAYGMPAHVTVLYPFLPRERLDDGVLAALRDLFAARRPFQVAFGGVGRFPGVLHLAPEPDDPLRKLTEAAVGRWPEAPPYGGRFGDVVPHLTVAEGPGGEVSGEAVAGVAADLAAGLPITTLVSGVTLRVFGGENRRAEGFDTVAQWRAAHERFWTGPEMSAALRGPPVIDDDTLIVAERFRLRGLL